MMPGTADSIAKNEPLGQRPAVMGARRSDHQQVGPAPYKQCRCITDAPKQHCPVGQIRRDNSLREIWSIA